MLDLGGHTWRGIDDPEVLAAVRATRQPMTPLEARQAACLVVAIGLMLNALFVPPLIAWLFPNPGGYL